MAKGKWVVEAPVRTEKTGLGREKGEYEEDHPAFGTASVTRAHGSARTLFQSDIQHTETIVLSIHRATRGRMLMRDWVHPRKELIEIEMSLAQWGSLVSAMGIGGGVPVTIRRTEGEPYVPGLPYEPRIATVVSEAKGKVGSLFANAKESLTALAAAIEGKKGIREIRDALRYHESVIRNAEGNAEFAVKSVTEATEHVVGQAKADIEAYVLRAANSVGLQLPSPVIPELGIEAAPGKPDTLSIEEN
jgi:hypothetical protein